MSATDGGPVPPFPDEFCSYCGTRIPPFGTFCPNCGALRASLMDTGPARQVAPAVAYRVVPQAAPAKSPSWRVIIKTILAFGMISFVAQLVAGLAALIYGTTIVLPEIIHHSYTVFVIVPVLVAIFEISGEALAVYYLLIVSAIVASAVWVFLSSAKGYYKELTMKAESRKHSALFDLCGLMFGVLFLNVAVVFIIEIFWGMPESPTEGADLWELLFLLANASVWEELIVRVLMIGVPLLFIDLVRKRPQARKHRYLLGGGFALGPIEVILILASSALFGLGHLEGWGAWKVFPTAVAGVAFGYLFMRHGLASAIMLHFGFDYLSMPVAVFADESDLGVAVIQGVAMIAWVIVGAVFFGYYIIRMIEFVAKRTYFDERPIVPTMFPYPYGYGYAPQAPQWWPPQPTVQQMQQPAAPQESATADPRGYFFCPVCGYTEARWHEGRFQCLRCGTVV